MVELSWSLGCHWIRHPWVHGLCENTMGFLLHQSIEDIMGICFWGCDGTMIWYHLHGRKSAIIDSSSSRFGLPKVMKNSKRWVKMSLWGIPWLETGVSKRQNGWFNTTKEWSFHQWEYPQMDGLQWKISLNRLIWGCPNLRKPPSENIKQLPI